MLAHKSLQPREQQCDERLWPIDGHADLAVGHNNPVVGHNDIVVGQNDLVVGQNEETYFHEEEKFEELSVAVERLAKHSADVEKLVQLPAAAGRDKTGLSLLVSSNQFLSQSGEHSAAAASGHLTS